MRLIVLFPKYISYPFGVLVTGLFADKNPSWWSAEAVDAVKLVSTHRRISGGAPSSSSGRSVDRKGSERLTPKDSRSHRRTEERALLLSRTAVGEESETGKTSQGRGLRITGKRHREQQSL